jgi:hypothetical protein
MPFEPGKPKTGGRAPGTPNRLTGAFREAILRAFNGLGGHAAFLTWARENQTEFYKICARLIPGELREDGNDRHVTIIINKACHIKDAPSIPESAAKLIASDES